MVSDRIFASIAGDFHGESCGIDSAIIDFMCMAGLHGVDGVWYADRVMVCMLILAGTMSFPLVLRDFVLTSEERHRKTAFL